MTRVDFYLLAKNNHDDVICRLVEKAYHRGHRVFIYADSIKQAEQLDEALWTFRDESFIPHLLQNEGPEPPPPVQLGWEEPSRHFNDILVNLSPQIPSWYSRFQRVLEIVPPDEAAKTACRERYKAYREAQCVLETHDI